MKAWRWILPLMVLPFVYCAKREPDLYKQPYVMPVSPPEPVHSPAKSETLPEEPETPGPLMDNEAMTEPFEPERPPSLFDADGIFQYPAEPLEEGALESYRDMLAERGEDRGFIREFAIVYHFLSPPDRWDYLDQSIEYLEGVLKEEPDDPTTLLFLGRSKAARALDTKLSSFKRLGLARGGFKLMDQALTRDQDNFSLVLARANAQLHAPGILGRSKMVAKDTAWLEERLERVDLNRPLHLTALGLIYLGDHAHRVKKDDVLARKYWTRASKLETAYREEALSRLNSERKD